MPAQKIVRCNHDAVWAVARFADQQNPGFDSSLTCKVGLRRCECLLDVAWIRDETSDAERRGNFVHVVQLIALHKISEPCRPRLHSNSASAEVREGVHRGISAHKNALGSALHRTG